MIILFTRFGVCKLKLLTALCFGSWLGDVTSDREEPTRRPVGPSLQPEGEELVAHHLQPRPQGFVLFQALAQMQPQRRRALRQQLADLRHRRPHQHVHDGQELGLQVQRLRRHVHGHVYRWLRRKPARHTRQVSSQREQHNGHDVSLVTVNVRDRGQVCSAWFTFLSFPFLSFSFSF